MAIYSLNLKSIGKTTHAAGTAGAHLLYIARPDAQPELVADHMPTDPTKARSWMNRAENDDRKNARVVDKVRIALPRELTPQQRMQLVQDFARDLTGNRVPWFAAIHASGKDAHNPHCHLVIRDRDIETGKRVVRLSDSPRDRAKAGLEPKAVEWVRAQWEHRANQALATAGHDVRIDRRSLEAQGIDREPTIHIGPQAMHIDKSVQRPESKVVETGNGRVIDYPMIDAGRTRKDRHAEIVDFNLEKAARSPDFRTRETARFQRDQIVKDRALENSLIVEARRRTMAERRYHSKVRKDVSEMRELKATEEQSVRDELAKIWKQGKQAIASRQGSERDALKSDHGRFMAKFMRTVDITGRTKKRQDSEAKKLAEKQARERKQFVKRYRKTKAIQEQAVKDRYKTLRKEIAQRHLPGWKELRSNHSDAEAIADEQRQARAAERDQAEKRFDERIRLAEKSMKGPVRKGPDLSL